MKKKGIVSSLLVLLLVMIFQMPVFADNSRPNESKQVVIRVEEYRYGTGQLILPYFMLQNESGEEVTCLKAEKEEFHYIDYIYQFADNETYTYKLYSDEKKTDFLGEGKFTADQDNRESLTLSNVDFSNVIDRYVGQEVKVKVLHQDGRAFTASEDDALVFYLPSYDGDSYYNFEIVPNDTKNYVTQKGHFYVYTEGGAFKQLNLSDNVHYSLMKRHEFIAKVPKGAEIYHTAQSHFYMARDYEGLEKLEKESAQDEQYDYYKSEYEGNFMLRQSGKVTRYCSFQNEGKGSNFGGRWDTSGDTDIFTFRELTDNPKQVIRNETYQTANYFEANVMSNADMSRALELKTGEYYDLVPLRGWQAVNTTGSNIYYDPEYHYITLGDAAQTEVTDDDLIGQYGRIHAKGKGTSLVLYSYDAMEWVTEVSALRDPYGFFLYSALYPENTGVQVVQVDKVESGISLNVGLNDLDTVYYLENQTDATGTMTKNADHAVYTFHPESSYGDTLSVRVHDPYQVENGKLNIADEANWLDDSSY